MNEPKHTMEELLLWEAVRAGDECAFRSLFDLYAVPLCRYANHYTCDNGASEEIVLDIFALMWQSRTTLSINSSLRAYLFRSARNRALNFLRDSSRHISTEDLCDVPADTVADTLTTDELLEFIQQAIMSLPDKCREVFVLSRNEGASNKQIAEQMQISVKTVEAQISKALRRLREHLRDVYLLF